MRDAERREVARTTCCKLRELVDLAGQRELCVVSEHREVGIARDERIGERIGSLLFGNPTSRSGLAQQ